MQIQFPILPTILRSTLAWQKIFQSAGGRFKQYSKLPFYLILTPYLVNALQTCFLGCSKDKLAFHFFLPDPRGAGHAKAFQFSSVGLSVGPSVGWSVRLSYRVRRSVGRSLQG